jgi:dihydrolipoamide dehydrogenase
LPQKALVYGAGPHEVEAAFILASFGAKVFLVSDSQRILPQEDQDISQRITQAIREKGIEVLMRCSLTTVKKSKGNYTVMVSGQNEQKLNVEQIVIGSRKPRTEGLGLGNIGIALNGDGSVKVDDTLETSVKGLYAIGDITGGRMLSHVASSMGVMAAENSLGAKEKYPYHLIPRGLWTMPQVAAVGLSEEEAEKKGYEVEVGDFPYAINGLAMAENRVNGSVKIVSESEYGGILGVHIVGEHATELIGEAVMAMQLEGTADDLAKSIRIHPTYSEAVVDAARDVNHWALYLPKSR